MILKQYLEEFCKMDKGIEYCHHFKGPECKQTCNVTEESQKEHERRLEQIS